MASSSGTSNNTPGTSSDCPKDNRWYFTAEQLANSPSRRQGVDADQELSFRQLTAYLIQEMGQRLQVSQLCINTAIVYMHRFYAFHSFTHFHRNGMAAAALFLAAKVEEQPRKLEHVIKVAHMCLNQEAPHTSSDAFAEQAQDLVFNENVLLQTLGFDVAIDHPHTHVVKTCHLVKACKDLAQTSYFLASNSLHLTSMCLQYRPTVVACFCIYLACKWSRWEIPQSTEGRHWFHYVDKSVTMDLLKQLTDEFIAIYEKSPARLKSKLNSVKALAQGARISETLKNIPESSNGSSSQNNQIEQASRRPETHSSHHKSHHISSHPPGSAHHHHNKVAGEIGEHKPTLSHKPSYPPNVGHSSRGRPERSQNLNETQYSNVHGGTNKQMPTVSSNSRSLSNSNRPQHNIPPVASAPGLIQRTSHSHDSSVHHKNRSTVSISSNNPQISSHKLLQKSQDPTRIMMKDSLSRPLDSSKLPSKHSNNSIYSSQSSNNVGLDMSRNVLQSQTSLSSNQQQSHHQSQQQQAILHQQQQQQQQQPQQQRSFLPQANSQPSNNSQSILSKGNINRYDQSVQQTTTQIQTNQKQSNESSIGISNTKPLSDENLKSGGDPMEICSPNFYSQTSSAPQVCQQLLQRNQDSAKILSLYSPGYGTERNPQQNNSANVSVNINSNNKLGFNIKSSRDSPKKEKRSETPKKDKSRSEIIQNQSVPSSKLTSQMEKKIDSKSIDISQPLTTLVSGPPMNLLSFDSKNQQIHPLNFSAGKRRASRENLKFNEELPKEMKVRKVESPPKAIVDQKQPIFLNIYEQQQQQLQQQQQPSFNPSLLSSSSSIVTENKPIKSFPSTINGIETNPDLVRSLLKESLCREGKYSTPLINSETKDCLDIEPIMSKEITIETLPEQLLQNEVSNVTEEGKQTDQHIKSKSEKKKKKEKHKHKEKDKSKDKEERKKHKKDKDRHKEKERHLEVEQNPVKIKISKDKLNLPPTAESTNQPTTGFKIKIPKDRIKGELPSFQNEENSKNPHQLTMGPSSLKIKISKDKIENFNHQQQELSYNSSSNTLDSGIGIYYGNPGSSTSISSHSSSKKKDRDRDRERDKEKEKKKFSSNNDYGKYNGNGNSKESNSKNVNLGGVGLYSTSSKIQQPSNLKIYQHQQQPQHQQHYNGSNVSMSQLFGEFYDDDDSDNDYVDDNSFNNDYTESKVN